MIFPAVAISILQPWAWFIVNGFKDVENRTWPTRFRGPVLIHTGKKFSVEVVHADAQLAIEAARTQGHALPDKLTLQDFKDQVGGIVGVATITGCVQGHKSPWASREPGTWHWTITDARPLPFMPLRGMLGFFPVTYVHPTPGVDQGRLA